MQNLVSIIIPTYNRAHLIGETLESVIAQSYINWECIVVDDGSSDYTAELMEFYKTRDRRISYHQRPKNRPKGANTCRNYGFEISIGKYVNWFDSDDLMAPKFIERKLDGFKSNTDMVVSKSILMNENEEIIGKEIRTKNSVNLLEDFITLKISWYLPDPMYRKKFLADKKLFDEHLLKGQDRDFHIRRLLENPNINFLDDYLTKYRQTDNSISQDFNEKTIKSLYFTINKLIKTLLPLNPKKETEYFLLKQQLKKYPFLYRNHEITKRNFLLFRDLGRLDLITIKWFIKYVLAVLSFKFVNKGQFFLRGE
ncbi:glycosyltransferase family 2 protein [Christiangramia sp. OXR-203]|uniref:glycosyltransferase family 2 protein n=1 Tax=Christiangramia sp. OXR-203 TaxID=3100176 RepID=UPI002AC8D4DC|nr:glycosyltransferase family 2 protein [Christiangramia sp. OXR-203]WPY97913.1 glycosyltransferase family 2 protein [Christiangramia sp. OXR-203]